MNLREEKGYRIPNGAECGGLRAENIARSELARNRERCRILPNFPHPVSVGRSSFWLLRHCSASSSTLHRTAMRISRLRLSLQTSNSTHHSSMWKYILVKTDGRWIDSFFLFLFDLQKLRLDWNTNESRPIFQAPFFFSF